MAPNSHSCFLALSGAGKFVLGDLAGIVSFVGQGVLGDLLHQGHDFVEVFTALEMHEDKNIFVVVVINLIEILMDDSCQSIDSWLIWNWLGSFELLSCASFMSG